MVEMIPPVITVDNTCGRGAREAVTMGRRRKRRFGTLPALVVGVIVVAVLAVAMSDGGLAAVVKKLQIPTASAPAMTPGPSSVPTRPAQSELPASALPDLLRVDDETRSPRYDRDLFEHWIDADGDGCNTRYEVLIDESTSPLTITDRCRIDGGTWISALDGGWATTPREIEIDHHIPLAEAWRSGASGWTDLQRQEFANDLGVPYALGGASSVSNQSKGDKDPARWLPTNAAHTCEYVATWALMKYRWSLAVDKAEMDALRRELSGECGATMVTLPEVRA